MEQLYTEYPVLYDAIQSDWDYNRDVTFVTDLLDRDPRDCRLLEIGCGTGNHTRLFADAGFDVTAVEPNEGMLRRARETADASYHDGGLPDLPVADTFDVVVAIRGVINHVSPGELDAALADMVGHLAADGLLVFDNSPLPPEGNSPAIDIGSLNGDQYARVVQMNPGPGDRLHWDQILLTPGGEVVVDTREMTPFDDLEIAAALSTHDTVFEPADGFGPADSRTVFVCRPGSRGGRLSGSPG